MRRIIFAGEGYPKTHLRELYELYSQRIELYNAYGPTECTCLCSARRVDELDFNCSEVWPLLGKIARNFRFYIIGADKKEVAPGDTGELILSGPGVCLGYYN